MYSEWPRETLETRHSNPVRPNSSPIITSASAPCRTQPPTAALIDGQHLDLELEVAVGHDSPRREAASTIPVLGVARNSGLLAQRHGHHALVPRLVMKEGRLMVVRGGQGSVGAAYFATCPST